MEGNGMRRGPSPRVAVVGAGYVGAVVAAAFAALGRQVVGLEVDGAKLRSLRAGRVPFYENGLEDLVRQGLESGRLRFTDDAGEAVGPSDVVFLCVGTPSNGNGADLGPLMAAARSIGGALDRHRVVVIKSTVPVGTVGRLASVLEEALPGQVVGDRPFSLVSNPEFLRQGSAVTDFLRPERVVVGSDDPEALDVVTDLYRPILEQSFPEGDRSRRPALVRTTLATAEAIKYASNAFLATKISFINELANVCELTGADVTVVSASMGLDPRIGPRFLDAGVGWGGSCFGKDLEALIATAREQGYEAELLRAVVGVNRRQRLMVVERLRWVLGGLQDQRVGLLGLAFKPGTDDLRDAPSVTIASRLLAEGAEVVAHDPIVADLPSLPEARLVGDPYEVAEDAAAIVLVTDWPEYVGLDLDLLRSRMRGSLLVDGRNLFDPSAATAAGFRYEGIGRVSSDAPISVPESSATSGLREESEPDDAARND